MSHIFISFCHEDLQFARSVREALQENDFDVWIDEADIPPGLQWEKEIRQAISDCRALVVIQSPASAQSYWVWRELTFAKEFRKPIFPLLHNSNDIWPLISDRQATKSVEDLINGLRQLVPLYLCFHPADKDFAVQLIQKLTAIGVDVWRDYNSPTGIQRGMEASQIMLLVLSPEAMQSTTVREQWANYDDPEKTIIPLLVQYTFVPPALREKKPYIDYLNQDPETAFAQLCYVLHGLRRDLSDDHKEIVPPQPPLPLDGHDMVNAAEKTIWISGLTLDLFANFRNVLDHAMGKTPVPDVRLIMLKRDVHLANETGAWVGINRSGMETLIKKMQKEGSYKEYKTWESQQKLPLTGAGRWVAMRVYRTQQTLMALLGKWPGKLEVRTIDRRLGTGHFIIDAYEDNGMLTAAPYFFLIDQLKASGKIRYSTEPIFLSRQSAKERDQWWFERYVREFELLWDHAIPWEPEPDD